MSWWQTRKARKDLEKLNIPGLDVDALSRELKQGMKEAKQVRKELRKQESPTYRKLIKRINDLTYKPIPAEQRYGMSLAMVHEAELSDWERNDLLEQIEIIYAEVLQAREYLQVLSSLNHYKAAEMTKVQKVSLSEQLIQNSGITEEEKQELLQQVKSIYKLD